jgi:uncharacterized protein (DUF2384 family)
MILKLMRAKSVFGSYTKAILWLAKPNRAMGGARPIFMTAREVSYELGRIEHGNYS